MAESKLKIFAVSGKVSIDADPKIRLIRATRRSEVESFLLNELNIVPASTDDCYNAAQKGIAIESAAGA